MTHAAPDRTALDVVEKATQRLRVLGALTIVVVAIGRRPEDPSIPGGAALAIAVAAGLLLVGLHARASGTRRTPHGVVARLGADTLLAVVGLWCTGSTPGDPATLVLLVPALVAAVRFGVLGAVACWAWSAGLLAVRTFLEWQPGDPLPLGGLGEASVVLLVVTLTAAYLAEHLAGHLAAAVTASDVATRRVDLLAALAAAGRDVSALDRAAVEEAARSAAEQLTGQPAAVRRIASDDATLGLVLFPPDEEEPEALVTARLTVCCDEPGATVVETSIRPDDVPLVGEALEVLGAQLAVALDNATLHERLVALSEELAHRAHHDPLTGLGNRAHLVERAAELVGDGAPGTATLLFVDLDGFKPVNDEHGHEAGDRVLVEIGRRLRDLAGDAAVVARLGGDEFAVLLTGAGSELEGNALRSRLDEAFLAPIDVGTADVVVGASIGLAVTGPDGSSIDDLLRAADARMYESKAARRPVRAGAR